MFALCASMDRATLRFAKKIIKNEKDSEPTAEIFQTVGSCFFMT